MFGFLLCFCGIVMDLSQVCVVCEVQCIVSLKPLRGQGHHLNTFSNGMDKVSEKRTLFVGIKVYSQIHIMEVIQRLQIG